ncbi:MAG: hypothetical protein KDN19_22020 [Verrucomicrobiae bacterium]|nr:hypothetical protein [Verrucomicrobiae bacterium]
MSLSPFVRAFGMTLAFVAGVALMASPLHGADEKQKKPARQKPKPVNLSAVKKSVKPMETSAVNDILNAPELEVDPDTPEHLRPVRLFNKDGRYVDARLLSASGEKVTLQRLTDNRTFDIAMATLDDASVRQVEAWLDRGPASMDFSLAFEVKKKLVESDSFSTLGRNFKMMNWAYDVVLTNQSRNELRDAELDYQIVYDDEVEVVRTTAYPGEGRNQREFRDVDLPPLGFNGRAEFTTPSVEMQTYEYEPTRGDREYRRDQIIGIWIRVMKNGEVIGEYMSHPAALESLSWNEDDDIEITVRDSFKEQFEPHD